MLMKMTKTMHQLVQFMKENGGEVYRHPGGFWGRREGYGYLQHSFGTSSVEAIVTRGVAAYTEWKDGKRGRFPVVARLSSTENEGMK